MSQLMVERHTLQKKHIGRNDLSDADAAPPQRAPRLLHNGSPTA
jgi:hypothetical protein